MCGPQRSIFSITWEVILGLHPKLTESEPLQVGTRIFYLQALQVILMHIKV